MLFTASHFQTECHHGTVYSISLSNPKGRQYPPDRCLTFLAPTPKMLADWHQAKVSGADMEAAWERYTNDYRSLLKSRWSVVKPWLYSLTPEVDVTVCCWEMPGTKPENHCHRNLVGIMVQIHRPECYGGKDKPNYQQLPLF